MNDDGFNIPERDEDALWEQLQARLNELGVPCDGHSQQEVGRFMNTPGAVLVYIDRPNMRILGCLCPPK